jgi:alginate O-acetyltransferase complex protein AlgI
MLFNSLQYFLFLPIAYLVFYVAGERVRWVVLLAASLLFYAAMNVPYLLVVLIFVATTTYCFGIWLDTADSPRAKRALLWGGIGTNVLILVVMKYLPFISNNLNDLSALLSLNFSIQPVRAFISIGVSFYVLQAISYLIDIYRRTANPELHFGYFALYLAFFPKILQGPIERANSLLPQLKVNYEFNYDNMRFGLLLFTWGLLKKVVIADRLGFYVDVVYKNVHAFTGLPLLLSTYAYTFQIYMDFSGYTDMALGTALLFNINLTQNFNCPYFATSVADFWRRWHISLTTWLRDYIYFPLGGSRGTPNQLVRNLFIVFLLSGLWHGSSWNFIIWGGLHGLFLACAHFYKPYQIKLHKALGIDKSSKCLQVWQMFMTFNLVNLAWVFFRAVNFSDALYVITNMWSGIEGLREGFLLSQKWEELVATLLALFIYSVIALLHNYANFNIKIMSMWHKYYFIRWLSYYFLIFIIIVLQATEKTNFIYFRF